MSSNCGDEGITSAIAEFGELGLADEVVAAHNTSLVSFEDRVNSMFLGRQPESCRTHRLMFTHNHDANVGEK